MPYRICKQCSKALPDRNRIAGRPVQFCEACAIQRKAISNRNYYNRIKDARPVTWRCLICLSDADDAILYPFCSEACRNKVIPALADRFHVTEQTIFKLEEHGLWLCLQDPTFTDADFYDRFAEHLKTPRKRGKLKSQIPSQICES